MKWYLAVIALLLAGITVQGAFASGMYPMPEKTISMAKNAHTSISLTVKNDATPKTLEFFVQGTGLLWNGVQNRYSQNMTLGAYEVRNVTVRIDAGNSDITVNAEYGISEGEGMFKTVTKEQLNVVVGTGVTTTSSGGSSSGSSGGGSSGGHSGGGGGSGGTTTYNYTSSCDGSYKLMGSVWVCVPRANASSRTTTVINGTVTNIQNNSNGTQTATVVQTVPSTQGGVPPTQSVPVKDAVMQDISPAEGGIAQGVVAEAPVSEDKSMLSETLIKMQDTVKNGSPMGLAALAFGMIAIMLQGVSYGMVRRSDAL